MINACLRILVLSLLFCSTIFAAEEPKPVPKITEKTTGMQKYPGYFPFYWDARGGKIWLEIDKLDTEFLYVDSLPAGVGSNDIGLDRGRLGDSRIVRFYR
ncbi:MAG TPA: peptidase, partial [Acidobacteriota bacterium]|nr:peptidase [Acidobacteriota bacterium]